MKPFWFIGIICWAGLVRAHTAPDYMENALAASDALQGLVEKMGKKRSRLAEEDFVRLLFNQMHRQVFRQFKADATWNEALQSGNYNCLTATAFFALVLDYFRIPYHIAETNYHVFILANVAGHTWLIETTDPIDGLISDAQEAEARMALYRTMPPPSAGRLTGYAYRRDYFSFLTINQLRGLDYFNQAVQAFNAGNLKQSVYLLQQASVYYQSERVKEVARILWLAVSERITAASLKADLERRLFIIQQLNTPAVASASGG